MRFNLRNRPRTEKNSRDYPKYYFETERWFEGFEKELREMLKREQGIAVTDDNENVINVLIRIKRILGENSS